MEVRYSNRFIRESETKRLQGLEKLRGQISEAEFQEFDELSLRKFIGWYIQRSINSQVRYGEEFVRKTLREHDEKSGVLSLEPAQDSEASPMTELAYPSEEVSQSQRRELADGRRKAAKALVRSSRYQSQFGGM